MKSSDCYIDRMEIRRILHKSRHGRLLVHDGTPGPTDFSIARDGEGRLTLDFRTADHRWTVLLNKEEEQELLQFLKSI